MKIITFDFEFFKRRIKKDNLVFYNFKIKRKNFFEYVFVTEIMGTDKENNLVVFRREDLIAYDDVIKRSGGNFLKSLKEAIEEKKHEMLGVIQENFENAVEGLLIMEAR